MTFSEAIGANSEAIGADEPSIDLQSAYDTAGIQELLDQLDRELIGLQPVKARIREIAALLVVNRAREQMEL